MSAFADKVVVITGAAGGIGSALVHQFGSRGAKIAALDVRDAVNTLAERLAAEGVAIAPAVADIADADQVMAAVDGFRKVLGPIDILVNNAGFSSRTTIEKTTPETWHHDVTGNLNGAFNCTHAVLPDMKAAGTGIIVNVASVNGLSALGDPAYSAAKAGMINFTQSLAAEYGRYGIRANVICPGTVRTPIWDERREKNPAVFTELASWYPLGRIVEPDEVAKVVVFLASDDASAITGAVLPVDCGLTAGNIVMTRNLTVEEM
ncbi:SDR family oxidoreductase [Bauldia sp.]|uniref:SDR family oxidoreductase n=1 Tax=Bauldia sp. TaxID=2575872 RepID=UPI003BA9414E